MGVGLLVCARVAGGACRGRGFGGRVGWESVALWRRGGEVGPARPLFRSCALPVGGECGAGSGRVDVASISGERLRRCGVDSLEGARVAQKKATRAWCFVCMFKLMVLTRNGPSTIAGLARASHSDATLPSNFNAWRLGCEAPLLPDGEHAWRFEASAWFGRRGLRAQASSRDGMGHGPSSIIVMHVRRPLDR